MNKQEIDNLIIKYPLIPNILPEVPPWFSQYDQRSANINYSFIREFKPKAVIEFGTRGGRCTHDILKALLENNQEFIFRPYEVEDIIRLQAQKNIDDIFGDKAVKIGGNIMTATDLPDNIDYLFVDNSHDYETTKWVFEWLLRNKVKDGTLVHFHDLVIHNNFEFTLPATNNIPVKGEMLYFYEAKKQGKFPLEKVYWCWEEGGPISSSWWRYQNVARNS